MRCTNPAKRGPAWPYLVALTLFWAGSPPGSLGQEIAALREDVRTSNPPSPDPGSGGSSGGSGGSQPSEEDPFADSVSGDWLMLVGGAAVVVGTAPFWGPATLMGDSWGAQGYFPAHPHQHDVGYMITSQVSILGEDAPPRYPWAWRGRTEFGTNLNGWSGRAAACWVKPRFASGWTPTSGTIANARPSAYAMTPGWAT